MTDSTLLEQPRGLTQIEIDQRVFDLYDEYCHGRMDRREFLLRAAAVTAGGLAMAQALMPRYAGKVDCIFIDPPYNTGNEGWAYNDNVKSPMIKEWLNDNPIGLEDGLRHDKWACMMWPR